MNTQSLVSGALVALLAAAGCSSEDGPGQSSEPPASEQQTASRASDHVLRLASLTASPPAAGASFTGLDEASDALDELSGALGDAGCAEVTLSADGDAIVGLTDCTFDGGIDLEGVLTVGYDAIVDCSDPLACVFEASVSVDADIVVDGIAVAGNWSITVDQDGAGSLSGAITATSGEFTVDVGLDVEYFADGSCAALVDYTDSNGNAIDIDAACY